MDFNENELANEDIKSSQLETEIKTMGSLVPGDRIVGADGEPVTVTHAYEKHLPESMYEIEMEDGEVIQASGNHLWYCETENDVSNKSEYERLAKVYFESKAIPKKEVEDIFAEMRELVHVFGEEVDTILFIQNVSKSLGHTRVGDHLVFEDDSAYVESLKYYSYNDMIDFLEEMKKAVLDGEGYFFFGQVRETKEIAKIISLGNTEINIPHKSDIMKK